MPNSLQYFIIVALILLIYFGYIRGHIKLLRLEKVTEGMSESKVRRLLGRPMNIKEHDNEKVYYYKFNYAVRMAPEVKTSVQIIFNKGKVSRINKKRL